MKYEEFMSDDKQYHSVLTAIANELAEANRLKRVELNRMQHPDTQKEYAITEDRA